jgi:hypothetical protein
MKRKPFRRWILLVLLICTVALVTTEKLDFLKTDTLAAALCTKELFSAKQDELTIVSGHKETISSAAGRYDLPPELLAANIYGHQSDLPPLRKFTDCAGSAMGRDMSLGLAQIRISIAANNDGRKAVDLSPADYKRYRALLLDPVRNTEYHAKELRQLAERAGRFPGISAEAIIHDPFVMALLFSEYRLGRQDTPSTASKLSGHAFWDLRLLLTDTVQLFGRDRADIAQIKTEVREYLEQVYCDGRIFNAKACDQWHRALPRYTGSD